MAARRRTSLFIPFAELLPGVRAINRFAVYFQPLADFQQNLLLRLGNRLTATANTMKLRRRSGKA